MSALVQLSCDCGDGNCPERVLLPVQTTSNARLSASLIGWDCDSIGGETVDWAPGHEITKENPRG